MTEIEALYDKEVKCLFCDQKFNTKKIRTRFIKNLEIDDDFCVTFQDEKNSPYLYFVFVCPHCGFSFSEQFSTYFKGYTRENVKTNIQDKWTGLNLTGERTVNEAIAAYKLAIYSAGVKEEKHIVIAGLYLRLAWVFRKENNADQEERFLKLALKEYTESYNCGDYEGTDMSEVKIGYLIGIIHKRLGNFKEAISYFSRVVGKQRTSNEHSIIKKARDEWYKVRELAALNNEEIGEVSEPI